MIKANLSSTLYLNHVLVIQCKSLYCQQLTIKKLSHCVMRNV